MWWWTLLKKFKPEPKSESKQPSRKQRLWLWTFGLLFALGAVGPVLALVNWIPGSSQSVMDRLRRLPEVLPSVSFPKSLPALPSWLPNTPSAPDHDPSTLSPAVFRFIATHPEFGPGWNPRPPRTWFGRERQIADSSRGPLVFYIEQDEVVAVRRLEDEARLWSKSDEPTAPNLLPLPNKVAPYASNGAPTPPLSPGVNTNLNTNNRGGVPTPSVPSYYSLTPLPRPPGLPAYSLLEVVQLYRERGGRYGSILVPVFSKKTPLPQREAFIKYVMQVEGLTEASLYCSPEAYQADLSERYARTHPRARRCSLGGIFLDLGVRWY